MYDNTCVQQQATYITLSFNIFMITEEKSLTALTTICKVQHLSLSGDEGWSGGSFIKSNWNVTTIRWQQWCLYREIYMHILYIYYILYTIYYIYIYHIDR